MKILIGSVADFGNLYFVRKCFGVANFAECLEKNFHQTSSAWMVKDFVRMDIYLKLISGHFGSVVSSYFTFLRWVIFVNLVISLIVVSFVVIPEVIFL